MLRRQERGEKRIMCNVDNEKKGKDIARYTKDDTRDSGHVSCGISFGLYRLSSSWCSLEAESDDIHDRFFSVDMEYMYRNVSSIFFFFSFFNLLSFPFLRKGRFSPRFSE